MELQEHSDHLDLAAAERKYMEELVPMLETIQGQPTFSCCLTRKEKAQLVRFAADMCLVKAVGTNARWGKALHETLCNITDIACVENCHNVGMPIGTDLCAAMKTPHHRDITSAQVGAESCASKSSCLATRTYYRGARKHANNRNRQQHATSHKYAGVGTHGDSSSNHVARPRTYNSRYRGAYAHGNDMLRLAMKGTMSYNAKIRKIYAEPVMAVAGAALVCSKEEHPHGMCTMASQIEDLQQLIPGGTSLIDVDSLLEETALYILALQMQVHSLHTLATAPPSPSYI